MQNIIIISNFPDVLNGKQDMRFTYLANLFAAKGYDVEMIISDFDHEVKDVRKRDDYSQYKFKITVLHEPIYSRNVSLKRLYAHYKWGQNVGDYLHKLEKKPDVVYCAMPSLTAALAAANYCKANHIKFTVDLQDLWPEAFVMAVRNSLLQKLFLPMKWYVDKVYASADLAVAVSNTYVERILSVNNKISSGISVFLGNDGAAFDEGRSKYHLERSDDEIVIAYVGNMSTSYDMPCVFDALAKVQKRGNVKQSIRFVLIGGGVDEDQFREYAQNTYTNTQFFGKKTYQEMAGMLCDCDIVVNPIVKGSVASIINKVGDYALAGKPVINTQESYEYRQLVEKYMCGINCNCGDSDDVADAIEKLALDPELRKLMGTNARRLGKEKFDRRNTYPQIVSEIERLAQ